MPIRPEKCPHCGNAIHADELMMEGHRVCPYCMRALNSVPPPQMTSEEAFPSDPGKEIPELSPPQSNMRWVQSAALGICIVSVVFSLILLFLRDARPLAPATLTFIAIIGLLAAFVWVYTQFARNLKSGPR